MFTPFAYMASSGVVISNPSASAYIDEVEAKGGTLTDNDKTSLDTFYQGLVTDGLYSKIKVMYPFMGAVSSSTAVDGIDPTNANSLINWQYSLSGSSHHTTDGIVQSEPVVGWGEILYQPADLFTSPNTTTMGFYSKDLGEDESAGNLIGLTANMITTNRFQMTLYNPGGGGEYQAISIIGTNTINVTHDTTPSALPSGSYIAMRESSTSFKMFYNGTSVDTNTSSNTQGSNRAEQIAFFQSNSNTTTDNKPYGTYGFIFLADGFDSTDSSNMSSRITTLMEDLGRQ